MSKPVRAGALRHRVTIEEFVIDVDSDGAKTEDWVLFADAVPAEIMALSGRELIAADAVQSKVTTRIKMRHRPGLKAAMRVRHRDTIYGIEGLIPDPDSGFRHVTLTCTSGVHEG